MIFNPVLQYRQTGWIGTKEVNQNTGLEPGETQRQNVSSGSSPASPFTSTVPIHPVLRYFFYESWPFAINYRHSYIDRRSQKSRELPHSGEFFLAGSLLKIFLVAQHSSKSWWCKLLPICVGSSSSSLQQGFDS